MNRYTVTMTRSAETESIRVETKGTRRPPPGKGATWDYQSLP